MTKLLRRTKIRCEFPFRHNIVLAQALKITDFYRLVKILSRLSGAKSYSGLIKVISQFSLTSNFRVLTIVDSHLNVCKEKSLHVLHGRFQYFK